MFLPALIPVLFLVACYVVGRSIDKWTRRRRQALVTVSGGSEIGGMDRSDT